MFLHVFLGTLRDLERKALDGAKERLVVAIEFLELRLLPLLIRFTLRVLPKTGIRLRFAICFHLGGGVFIGKGVCRGLRPRVRLAVYLADPQSAGDPRMRRFVTPAGPNIPFPDQLTRSSISVIESIEH